MRLALAVVVVLIPVARCYAISGVGPNGIDATGLQLPDTMPLNGAGIGIGQVEGMRPGKSTLDGGPDDPSNSARAVVPTQVYMGTTIATSNGVTVRDPLFMDDHGQQVASIMISTSGAAPGVAPNALLYSSAFAAGGDAQRNAARSANFIATRNDDDISAINMSVGIALTGGETTAGTSHLSRFVDWSAKGKPGALLTSKATDDFGWHAVENRVHVHDLHATVLHLLGVNHTKLTYRYSGRDYRLTDVHGNIVNSILA